jgi:hypothetical protein
MLSAKDLPWDLSQKQFDDFGKSKTNCYFLQTFVVEK